MSAHQIVIDVCLWTGVITAAFSAVALPLSPELLDRLHYMAPVADVSAVLILIAVLAQEGWGQAVFKVILIWAVLVIMNAVLAHATARAARVREFGHWNPQPHEKIAGLEPPHGEEHE